MGNRIPESSAPDHDALTAEEQRLGDLFELADQLAGDRVAQDAFLQSLTEADRQEIMTMLVYANALRIMGNETLPALQGRARQRLQEALQRGQRPQSASADWSVADMSSISSRDQQ